MTPLEQINAAIEARQPGDPLDVEALARDSEYGDSLLAIAERHAVMGVLERTATKYVYWIPEHE